MTASIAMAVITPVDASPQVAVPQADGDDGGFGATLGAAIAAQAGQLAPIVPEPVAAEPLVDLLTKGEWRHDETSQAPAAVEAGPSATPKTPQALETVKTPEAVKTTETGAEAPLVPLEKSLDTWFALVSRRPQPNERARVPASGDPAEVNVDAEPVSVAATEGGAGPKPGPATPIVAIPLVLTIPVVGASPDRRPAGDAVSEATATATEAATWLPREPGRTERRPGDPPRSSEPRSLEVGKAPRPASSEPVIEIAGFVFADREEGAGSTPNGKKPAVESSSDSPAAGKPAPEWVAKVRDLKTSGGDGPPARPTPGREEGTVLRPSVEQTRIVLAADRPAATREPARSKREGPTVEVADASSHRPEHSGTEAGPRAVPAGAAPVGRGSERQAVAVGTVATTPTGPADQGERIARRVDSLLLDLKDEQGDYGKLRVTVAGPNVRATIMPTDPSMADRLNVEIRQLHQTLQERGFPEAKLTVQNPAASELPRWNPLARETVAGAAAEQRSANPQGPEDDRRDRWNGSREQQERQEQDATPERPRRSRREQKEGNA